MLFQCVTKVTLPPPHLIQISKSNMLFISLMCHYIKLNIILFSVSFIQFFSALKCSYLGYLETTGSWVIFKSKFCGFEQRCSDGLTLQTWLWRRSIWMSIFTIWNNGKQALNKIRKTTNNWGKSSWWFGTENVFSVICFERYWTKTRHSHES